MLVPRGAYADPATAEALFQDGRRLLAEGHLEEACALLAESQAQDPASGTLINLALCHEKQGRVATAWGYYRAVIGLAKQDGRMDRAATAEQKAAELEPRVPRLVLMSQRPVPGLRIEWASVVIGAGALGSPVAVDPGSYRILVTAPGYRDWSTTVVLTEGEWLTLELPDLEPAPAPVVTAASRSPRGARPKPADAKRRSEPPPKRSALGFLVGGFGLVALGTGAGFGVSSLSAYADAERACPTRRDCTGDAMDAREKAEMRAWIANVSVGVGVLATAAGVWLVFRPFGRQQTAALELFPLGTGAGFTIRAAH